MKNITVSLPDGVYRQARITAAEQDTSVSALVKTFLIELGTAETDFKRRKRLQARVLASVGQFRAADRLDRANLHAR